MFYLIGMKLLMKVYLEVPNGEKLAKSLYSKVSNEENKKWLSKTYAT